jgi:mannose-6-phosphate isomerase-like protein (cupin superfamily)
MPTVDDKGREFDLRPWGNYTVLDDDASDHKIKRIVVEPGKRLSYQRHSRRAEHWFVIEGVATVTLNDVEHKVKKFEAIEIPREMNHRVANEESVPLILIEIQYGDYFGEDDIVRLEDDYGRQ